MVTCVVVAVVLAAMPLRAANLYWSPPSGTGSGLWSDGRNWDGTGSLIPPKSTDNAYVMFGGTATINSSGAVCSSLYLGDPNATDSGTIQMTGGGLWTSNNEYVGNNGLGTFIQSGGTHSTGNGDLLCIGYDSSASGDYILSGGLLSLPGYSSEFVGTNGPGTFTQSGGTNDITGFLELGVNPSSSGTYGLSGSGLLLAADEFVGNSSSGTLTQSGGTNNVAGGLLFLGNNSGSSGTYNLSGGYLPASYTYIGYSGSGSFTQSGGTNSCGNLTLGTSAGGSGTYNLNGGLLALSSLGQGSGSATFNFNGGTLQAASGFSCSLPMTLGTSGGGATFDTAGYTVTFSGSLSGPGGLNKIGSGELILSGTNSYDGGTNVTAGTLVVTNNTALPDGMSLTVGTGGTFVFDPSLAGELIVGSSPAADVAAVPEPGTLALLAAGAMLAAFGVRRLATAFQ